MEWLAPIRSSCIVGLAWVATASYTCFENIILSSWNLRKERRKSHIVCTCHVQYIVFYFLLSWNYYDINSTWIATCDDICVSYVLNLYIFNLDLFGDWKVHDDSYARLGLVRFGSLLNRMQNKMRAERTISETVHQGTEGYKEFLFPLNRYFSRSLSFSHVPALGIRPHWFSRVSISIDFPRDTRIDEWNGGFIGVAFIGRTFVRKRVYFLGLFKIIWFSRGRVRAISSIPFRSKSVWSKIDRSFPFIYVPLFIYVINV
jgi:hypothetical protein